MFRAMWTSAAGMTAQQQNLDVISNNMANVDTVGYKQLQPVFDDLIYQTVKDPGMETSQNSQNPIGYQLGLGTYIDGTYGIFTQGNVQQTGNPLDVAIQGNGFFQVAMPDGTIAYTRNGQFQLDANGDLVTADGYLIQPQITIPPNATSVNIGPDGTVAVTIPGQQGVQVVGQLQLANFVNPAGLKRIGNNLFEQTQASGNPIVSNPGTQGLGTLLSGYVEASNVNIVNEMVNLIIAERAYQFNAKGITAADTMLSTAANLYTG